MAALTQRILGLADVRAKMLRLAGRDATNLIRRALNEGAGVIRDEARRLVQVQDVEGGGTLQKSIVTTSGRGKSTYRSRPNELRAYVLIKAAGGAKGAKAVKRGESLVRQKNPRRYAHLVEGGTRPHAVGAGSRIDRINKAGNVTKRGGRQHGRMHPGAQAFPFMKPAFYNKRNLAVQVIASRVRSELDALVRGRPSSSGRSAAA